MRHNDCLTIFVKRFSYLGFVSALFAIRGKSSDRYQPNLVREGSMVLKQYCCALLSLTLLAVLGWQGQVQAQDPPVLGDEAILFVNGPNVLIPSVAAEVVNDPLDAGSGNLVAKFNNGSWT